jgi:hypothetical protein
VLLAAGNGVPRLLQRGEGGERGVRLIVVFIRCTKILFCRA